VTPVGLRISMRVVTSKARHGLASVAAQTLGSLAKLAATEVRAVVLRKARRSIEGSSL
jgi:hypothetical protein